MNLKQQTFLFVFEAVIAFVVLFAGFFLQRRDPEQPREPQVMSDDEIEKRKLLDQNADAEVTILPAPEASASFFSVLTFTWMNGVFFGRQSQSTQIFRFSRSSTE
eukprot:GABV01003590.1.p1 GENE.GABV01003590.1~~GABV01003590.1.p1  ORF type:complete len:105 (-),score=40.08 GABV01003590.1:93-407(-)